MLQIKKGIYYVVVNYKEGDRWKKKWISTRTDKLREARAMEKEIEYKAANGMMQIRAGKRTPTVREFLNEWLETCIKPPSRKPATYESYRAIVRMFSEFAGNTKIDKLSSADIDAYIRHRLKAGNSHTFVRIQFRTLRSAFNTAARWKLLAQNPCANVTQPVATKTPRHVATIEEVQKLLNIAAARECPIAYVIVTLGALCGLRRGEICGLEWKDVELDRGLLHIRHSMSRRENETLKDGKFYRVFPGEKSSLVLDSAKTIDSQDDIYIPGVAIDALKKMKLWQDKCRFKMGPCYEDTGMVIVYETGRPPEPNLVYSIFQELRQEADLPPMRVHDLRHTAATLLLAQGVDIKLVSHQLRHSDVAITQNIYQHVTEALARKSADAMDEIFAKNPFVSNRNK